MNMITSSQRKKSFAVVAIVLSILLGANAALAQTTSFTYQGRLTDGGTPANGNYDLQFALFDSLSGGAQVGCCHFLRVIGGNLCPPYGFSEPENLETQAERAHLGHHRRNSGRADYAARNDLR